MTLNVFYSNLNEFCRKYLVEGESFTNEEIKNFETTRKKIESEIFENLALFDQVNFKVYGENIPLALMIRLFGEAGLEELLDQGAIRFTLWTPMVLQLVENIEGIDPILSGSVTSKVHSDPEESIELGLNWLEPKFDRSRRRTLSRKIRDLYTLPDRHLPADAVKMTKSAYLSGRLKTYGFNHDGQPFHAINQAEKKVLLKCTDDLLEYLYLLSSGQTSFSKSQYFDIFTLSQNRIITAEERVNNFSKILRLEQFPDLGSLYSQTYKPFDKIIQTRAKRSARIFRKWLNEKSSSNEQHTDITKEYIDAIVNEKGFFKTKSGKFTKTIAMASIGSGIGALIAGIPGSMAGAGIIKIAEPAVDFAIDLVDEFLLDGLLKGWTPRLFIDDLRKSQEFNKNSTQSSKSP